MRIGLLTVIFCTLTSFAFAQSTYAPLNEDYYHSIDRYEVKSGRVTSQLFTGVKPYKRSDIVAFLDTLRNDSIFTSRSDRFNYDYSDEEIRDVAERTKKIARRADQVHVVFNNNALDFAPHAALRLRAALGQIVKGRARQADLFR